MTKELKPCPCCGNKPELSDGGDYAFVLCRKCRYGTAIYPDKDTAIDMWNWRHAIMSEKFSRKCIREFIEYIKPELFKCYSFSRETLCDKYFVFANSPLKSSAGYPALNTIDDKIEFINTLKKCLGNDYLDFFSDETGNRCISFCKIDPCNIEKWNEIMNSIYSGD